MKWKGSKPTKNGRRCCGSFPPRRPLNPTTRPTESTTTLGKSDAPSRTVSFSSVGNSQPAPPRTPHNPGTLNKMFTVTVFFSSPSSGCSCHPLQSACQPILALLCFISNLKSISLHYQQCLLPSAFPSWYSLRLIFFFFLCVRVFCPHACLCTLCIQCRGKRKQMLDPGHWSCIWL